MTGVEIVLDLFLDYGEKVVNAARSRVLCWRYSRVFGPDASRGNLHVVYALLCPPVLSSEHGEKVVHVFRKPGLEGAAFSMSAAVSVCELRAAKYLSESVADNTGKRAVLTSDEDASPKRDLSFISLGLLSNRKSLEVLKSVSNPFADLSGGRIVSKATGKTIAPLSLREDYGLILKINPPNFPSRSWICCGGLGEWGTSGAAWFLARKWKDIHTRFGAKPFCICVRVVQGSDESAIPVRLAATPEELETPAREI